MGFHNVTLDSDFIGYGSVVGPGHRTFIQDSQSGIQNQRKKRWNQSRRRFSLTNDIDEDQLRDLFEFILCRRGSAHSFLIRDPIDFTTATDQKSAPALGDILIGTADGSRTEFTMKKLYETGTAFENNRFIRKLVPGQVLVGVAGSPQTLNTDFTLDHQLGRLSFVSAPASGSVTAGFEFRVQVRFGKSVDDLLGLSYDTFRTASYSLDLMEDMTPLTMGERYVPTTDLTNYGGGSNFLSSIGAPLVSPFYLDRNHGLFIEMNPELANTIVRLPDIDTTLSEFGGLSMFANGMMPAGGPYFAIHNSGTKTITLEQFQSSSWGSVNNSQIVNVDQTVEAFIDEDGEWRAV